jgi:tetratricopeptide (TPR) repeat protein
VELDPRNLEYLRARATLANWNQEFDTALDSYSRILTLAPGDLDATLGSARASHWKGKDEVPARFYRAYLERRPDDRTAAMEYIEVEAARGDKAQVAKLSEAYRKRFGESLEFWLRMADIYGLSGEDRAAAEALQNATRFAPDDPKLYFQLAQTYPDIQDAKYAQAAIERAVALDPKNLEYLRARADLAAWNSDYKTALDSYERILKIAPDDAGAVLGIARVNWWTGQTDKAIRNYRAYLARFPQVQLVWNEYIEVVTENGDYARAVELLEQYRQRFGETDVYKKQKARVLAWAERPTPSLAIVSELQPTMPDDYHLAYTRTLALAAAHRPRESLASLDDVARLGPGTKETYDLQRVIKTPLRSYITGGYGYEDDSNHVRIQHYGLSGAYVLSPETRLLAAVDELALHAPVGSGFENADSTESNRYDRAWVGASHLISPRLSVDALAGGGTVQNGGGSNFVYRLGANLQPRDELALRLEREQDIFAVSPRAASLGILRRANRLGATWTPDLRWTVEGLATYDNFSDGNRRWEAELAPRRAFVRNQFLNLDLGVSGRWFGFSQTPDNGYYSPRWYRRYAVTAFSYWKIDDDNGVSLTFSVGPFKDNTMTGYRMGEDVAAEGFFGIYRDWYLNPRVSLTRNEGGTTESFHSKQFEVFLTRRF